MAARNKSIKLETQNLRERLDLLSQTSLLAASTFIYDFDNKKLKFEINQIASRCDLSIRCCYGNTTVLTALTIGNLTRVAKQVFPLVVTFEERSYSTNRVLGNISKREGRPSDEAIVVCRFIDRTLRPFLLLPSKQAIKISNLVTSIDESCDPRLLASWSSFLVCYLSRKINFETCLATWISKSKENVGEIELVVSATKEDIVMLEVSASEITEQQLDKSLFFAQEKIRTLISFFQDMFRKTEMTQRIAVVSEPEEQLDEIKALTSHYVNKIFTSSSSWAEKEKMIKTVRQEIVNEVCHQLQLEREQIEELVENIWATAIRRLINELQKQQTRLDGRKFDEIRSLTIQKDYLPSVHGSTLFRRGDTQVLSVVTVAGNYERQPLTNVLIPRKKWFSHHYNFLSFSINEITSSKSLSRREIGHSKLVQKTFDWLLPPSEIFPFAVRAVSDVLSADGSTSQASICAVSEALMLAGVPLKRLAAGISMGLFNGEIYTDINAVEDQFSDMDFKIAATRKGICSIQLDVKVGVSPALIAETVVRARQTLNYVLTEMEKHVQPSSTRWKTIYIGSEKLGFFVGPRAAKFCQLMEEMGVVVNYQNGYLNIYHPISDRLLDAHRYIKQTIGEIPYD